MIRQHLKIDFKEKHAHKEYVKNAAYRPVALKKYKTVCSYYNDLVIEFLIKEGGEYLLPCNIGELKILKRKINLKKGHLKIDWKLTKQYKKLIYHLNENFNGFYGFFYWRKGIHRQCANKKKYRFKPYRINQRALSKYIKENPGKADYITFSEVHKGKPCWVEKTQA